MVSTNISLVILALFIFFNGANLNHEYKHVTDLDLQIHSHTDHHNHENECEDCHVFEQLSNIYVYKNYVFNQKINDFYLSIYQRNLQYLTAKNLSIRGPPTNS